MAETQRERVPRNDADERDTALAFLNFGRSCVFKKVAGLSETQMRERLVPSETTLLGLVKHLADTERWWFAHHLAGDPRYAELDFSFEVPRERSVTEVAADYRAAIAEADRHLAAAASMATLTALPVEGSGPRTLRWVLTHVNTEVARHLGHMDILREQVDGTTGR